MYLHLQRADAATLFVQPSQHRDVDFIVFVLFLGPPRFDTLFLLEEWLPL